MKMNNGHYSRVSEMLRFVIHLLLCFIYVLYLM